MFSMNYSVTKFVRKRLFELAASSLRDQDVTTAPVRQVRERIFKLTAIHVPEPVRGLSDSLNLLNFPSV